MDLTFTLLWANSADDKLMTFFPENRLLHFMQMVALNVKTLFSGEKKGIHISRCRLLNFFSNIQL